MTHVALACVVAVTALSASGAAEAQSVSADTDADIRSARSGGVTAVVLGIAASIGGDLAGALVLATAPQPVRTEVSLTTAAWSLALHATAVAWTIYGGVLIARSSRSRRYALPTAMLLPYATTRETGVVFVTRF